MNYFNIPTEFDLGSISNTLMVLYLIAATGIAIVSLVALAVLRKHAEHKSIATGVAVTYVILFGIVFLFSLGNLIQLIHA